MLAGFSNAFYDNNSVDSFKELNQQKYIVEVLSELNKQMLDFSHFNFIFFSGNAGMKPEMMTSKLPHKILIQWEDQLGTEPTEDVMKSFDFVFKTHLRHKSKKYNNLFSYPLGIPYKVEELPIVDIKERLHPVFFAGNLNDCRIPFYQALLKSRRSCKHGISFFLSFLMDHISEKSKYRNWNLRTKNLIFKIGQTVFDSLWKGSVIRFTRGFQAGFSPKEYAKILSQSKIVLSPCGFFNTECFRFYEALRQGCIVITEKLPETDYYDSLFYIEVENWKNIDAIINRLLQDESKMENMSRSAKNYYQECLSPKGVAKYIISKISSC